MPRRKHDDIIIRKMYPFTLGKAEGERVITGDANVYGILDSVGDIVEPGAFKNSLAADDVRHLLWQHDTYEVIGDGVFAETDTALRLVEGNLYEGVQRAEEAYAICKQARRPLGLSIGFAITKDGQYTDDEGVRHITDAKLYEVSLVTFPANSESMVDGVKAVAEDYRSVAETIMDADLSLLDEEDLDELVTATAYLADALTPDEPAPVPTVEADEAARALQSAMLAAALL
jgi:HK97 family phage prohead protease